MLKAGSTKAMMNWINVIEGTTAPLVLGYFCTRQRDESERAKLKSSREARAMEEQFFKETPPWSSSKCPERFGIGNLIAMLSTQLVGLIATRYGT
jgi:hypothetical protein